MAKNTVFTITGSPAKSCRTYNGGWYTDTVRLCYLFHVSLVLCILNIPCTRSWEGLDIHCPTKADP